MAESKSSEAPKGSNQKAGYDQQAGIAAALSALKKAYGIEATAETLQDAKVYPNVKVVLVLPDFRKFTFSWEELGLAAVPRSALPEDMRLV